MELKLYLGVLLGKWRIVLAAFAITLLTSVLLTWAQEPVYRSTATYVVKLYAVRQDDRVTISALDALGRPGILGTFVELANSRLMKKQASDELELTSEQRDGVSVQSRQVPATNVIEITVEASDPYVARDLAVSVGQKTAAAVRLLYDVYELQLVDSATAPSRPVKPNWLVNTVLGALTGLVLGASLAFLAYYLQGPLESPARSTGQLDGVERQRPTAAGSIAPAGPEAAPAPAREARTMAAEAPAAGAVGGFGSLLGRRQGWQGRPLADSTAAVVRSGWDRTYLLVWAGVSRSSRAGAAQLLKWGRRQVLIWAAIGSLGLLLVTSLLLRLS